MKIYSRRLKEREREEEGVKEEEEEKNGEFDYLSIFWRVIVWFNWENIK